ncbi:hypothetical protein ACXET9_05235 [Brachybacterium sp. DNPG3]
MLVLSILVYAVSALAAVLAIYYTAKDLSADLVLLGAAAAVFLVWLVQAVALGVRDLAGGVVDDPITLYGYLLTAVALPLAAGWISVWERSRWGSLTIAVASLTSLVLEMRVHQIWAGGFA